MSRHSPEPVKVTSSTRVLRALGLLDGLDRLSAV